MSTPNPAPAAAAPRRGFVHLVNRSQYSLLDGAMAPAELVARAQAFGQPAVALTDTCNLYGAFEFYKAAKDAGLNAIIGVTLWISPLPQAALASLPNSAPDDGWHLTLLIEGQGGPANQKCAGYKNVCKLVTDAIFYGMHYRPRVDLDQLRAASAGLICLTGGLNGPLGPLAVGGPEAEAEALARLSVLRDIFGSRHLFVELQDYGLAGQAELNAGARRLAAALGLDTVVTNDCRYVQATDAVTLDLLNCIAQSVQVDESSRVGLPTDQQYVKSEDELRALFPDDGEAISRTVEIAARCTFKFKTAPPYFFPATEPPDPDPPRPAGVRVRNAERSDTDANWAYFYRAFPPPLDFGIATADGSLPARPPGAGNINGYFEWFCQEGLKLRIRQLGIPEEQRPEYEARLAFELDVIEEMEFPAYLLIVAEFINWAKDHEIPVGPGRGSGAGALVNWAMRITDIDPLRFGLLMERFLNPERVSMPDIDVDFCQDRREEVIAHTREKYGQDLVSQIITYGKLQAKAALKDVARTLGLDFKASDRITKLVPNELGIKLEKAYEEERLAVWLKQSPVVARVGRLALRVEGMTRQTGVHAAGVVIADRPLVEHAPMYRDGPEGGPVVQYEMKAAESVGLIKFDFLGLKTLDQIRDAVKMIHRNTGVLLDLQTLPLDDEPTYKLLQKGDALGVFQVESSGMRDLLTRLRPTNIDDLIALLALYRPGPLSSGMVDNFIDCKHGRKPIEYAHPCLEPILVSTYGSIVYQEQVMQIAQVYSGYTLGGADLLRRAMGKKKAEEMAKQKATFVDGAITMGRPADAAETLFDTLAYFAGYGFNKSHSAAYGVVSYHTAYLKAHHRAEYMSALMTIDSGNTEKVLLYIGDCKRGGLEVLPPDVNESQYAFDVPANNRGLVRFGLSAVKGVGEDSIRAILDARAAASGRFSSFLDCLERLDHKRVSKKVLELLICCGAFDWTGDPRRAMVEALPAAVQTAISTQDERRRGQASLFGGMGAARPPAFRLPACGEWPMMVRLEKEKEALGFFITGHPIAEYADTVRAHTSCRSIDLLAREDGGKEVRVAGMVSALREITNKKGAKMAFATLQDEHGSVECVFFAEFWALSRAALTSEAPLIVAGKVEKAADGAVKILAQSASLLSTIRETNTRQVLFEPTLDELTDARVEATLGLFRGSPGRKPVRAVINEPGAYRMKVDFEPAVTVTPDDALIQGLKALYGRPDIVRLA
jgi:DNA polymerase-3 subunit alpha